MGAPVGNQNAARAKVWQAAILRALDKRGAGDRVKALDELAEFLLAACSTGELAALKELGDRLDGKPAQTLVGDANSDPIQVTQIQRVIVDPRNRDTKGI
jgi:hypothetical protein